MRNTVIRREFPSSYLHGGPGAGCDKNAPRFFDPQKCCIILFDQRGSGRSRPYAETSCSTTWYLVEDIRVLLTHLGKQRVVLFGGSWGSTLALVYAIRYPETVMGMVLRGIFLSERHDVRDYLGGIPNTKFPDVWKRFVSRIPPSVRGNPAEYYFAKMTSGEQLLREAHAYEWAYYENARLFLKPKNEDKLQREIKRDPYVSLAVLEAHFIKNLCFLADGYIIRNAAVIPHVPHINHSWAI